tara:strand:- start:834 stop:1109 length:276 start_codon:yes stop_codon:yes gene_type:complete
MNKKDMKYIEGRIESMLIGKIAHYRLKIRELIRSRHKAEWPELHKTSLKSNIRQLRTWLYIAALVDESKNRLPKKPVKSNAVIVAEKLTAL